MENMKEILVPNDVLIANMLQLFGKEGIDHIKENKISKFDFALTIVALGVENLKIEMNVMFDLMFGEGSYDKFCHVIYDELAKINKK